MTERDGRSGQSGGVVLTEGWPPNPSVDSARGWVVVAAAFVSMFVVYGIVYSFGAFFDSMAEDFGTGKGATALMFSITTAWYFGLGLVSGKAADRFGPRPVLLVAAGMLGLALVATSRVQSIWVGYLTYGLGVGIAVACAYVPMVADRRRVVRAPPHDGARRRRGRHRRRHARAGPAVGAPDRRLRLAHGLRRARRRRRRAARAGQLRRPPPAARARSRRRRRCARSCATAGSSSSTSRCLLLSTSLFVPFVFIKSYATDEGIDAGAAATLVGIIGASSVVGRLGLGALGQPARRDPADAAQLRRP